MKHHPSWLALGLVLFVVLACNLGKNRNSNNSNSNNSNANANVETEQPTSDSAIKEIHMAKDDGHGKPGSPTFSFEPSDRTLHCVATLKEAHAGTEMRFSWWIVDADGTQNRKIKDIDYTTRTLEDIIHGHLSLPQDWPIGKYKVQVYVNGNLDRTVPFTVQ
jgi:hypothetical protein